MTSYRCIKCCDLLDASKFPRRSDYHYGLFCKDCYDRNASTELRVFREVFWRWGREIFCLEYSESQSELSVSIPSDNEGKRKMINELKEDMTKAQKMWKETAEREMEKDSSSESFSRASTFYNMLESYRDYLEYYWAAEAYKR